jgi:hypothetical protein
MSVISPSTHLVWMFMSVIAKFQNVYECNSYKIKFENQLYYLFIGVQFSNFVITPLMQIARYSFLRQVPLRYCIFTANAANFAISWNNSTKFNSLALLTPLWFNYELIYLTFMNYELWFITCLLNQDWCTYVFTNAYTYIWNMSWNL